MSAHSIGPTADPAAARDCVLARAFRRIAALVARRPAAAPAQAPPAREGR